MDTKLKADIAENAVTLALLKQGRRVLKPIGDRLPYDLVIENGGRFIKLQVKYAWRRRDVYIVDNRRTRTNRRAMVRALYRCEDFDYAILFIESLDIYYVMPVSIFISYKSEITLSGNNPRQRKSQLVSDAYFAAWHLLDLKPL